MKTVVVGSQTGNADDYKLLKELCDDGTIIVDDSNHLLIASITVLVRVYQSAVMNPVSSLRYE
jgi:nitrogenase molybdenum-iron protein alpha/beta subunit